MCCRYRMEPEDDDEELERIIAALSRRPIGAPPVRLSGDVCPTDCAAVIASNRALAPGVFAMRWGYAAAGRAPVINARSETAHERPMFEDGMKNRRCLIPASWYYEWERRGRERVRYAIRPDGAGLTYMAGLYRLTVEGAQFTVLTREALADWIDPRRDGRALLDAAVTAVRFGAA